MRALGPLMKALDRRGWSVELFGTEESLTVADRYGLSLSERLGFEGDAGPFGRLLQERSSSLVVTGVAECTVAERTWLAEIRRAGIPSLGILDTWGGYGSRLGRVSMAAGEYPDVLAVMNDQARQEIETVTGWPFVVAAGNPGLEEFLLVADVESRRTARAALGIEEGREVAIFFSQPILQALGTSIGYTQHDALRSLCAAATPGTLLIVAAHPRDDADELRRVAGKRARVLERYDPAALYAASDLVVSCFSACLLEAAIALKPTLSIQPGLQGANRCWSAVLGVSESACSAEEVSSALERTRSLGRSPEELQRRRDLIGISPGAVERLVTIAEALIRRRPAWSAM
jgi:hypothetical protein